MIPSVKRIINLFRKWFRRGEARAGPVMVSQIVTRRSARLVYQRRHNGIEPLMTPVKSRRRVTR